MNIKQIITSLLTVIFVAACGGGGGGGTSPDPYPTPAPTPAPTPEPTPEPTPGTQEPVWINEFHYDNQGNDQNEFIEVAGEAGTDLQGYKLVLYSGGDSGHYGTINLSGTIEDEGNTGYGAVSFSIPTSSIETGLQNGPNDGIGLVNPDNECAEFFSYEGDLTASAGTGVGGGSACDGEDGIDIGVFEKNR